MRLSKNDDDVLGYPAFAAVGAVVSAYWRRNSRFSTLPAPDSGNGSPRMSTLRGHL
jgi:hypothetical protein